MQPRTNARGPMSLEKRVAAGPSQKVPLHKQEVFLSEVRGRMFNLKHVTLLLKLSEGFSPTGSVRHTAVGIWGPGSKSWPLSF